MRLAGAVLAVAAGTQVAAAAPSEAPVLAPVPAFVGGAANTSIGAPIAPAQRITWSPVAIAGCRSYGVEIEDLTAGTVREREVMPAVGHGMFFLPPGLEPPGELRFGPAPSVPRDATNVVDLPDGHLHRFRVRAVSRTPGPSGDCRASDVGPTDPGPYSPPSAVTRYDGRDPVVEAVIAGGAPATRTPEVTVDAVTLLDPDPPGFPGAASGIAGVIVDGVARDRVAGDRYPFRLEGPDGIRRVTFAGVDRVGHAAWVTDDIVLDRVAPPVALVQAAPRVPVGAVAAFDASATTDPPAADGSAAGVRPGSFRWRFGDGLPGAVTPAAVHVFRRRGVMCGEVTVRDRAGNVGRREFVTRVDSGGAVLGAVRVRRAGRSVVVEACVARRAAVVVAVRGTRGAPRTRRARGGPGVVRVVVPAPAGRLVVRVASGADRRTLTRR